MTERIQILRGLVQEMEMEDDEDHDDTMVEEEELNADELDEILNASLLEITMADDTENIHIYTDENPYQVVDSKIDNRNIYQVIGNEIILITSGTGYCCLCSAHGPILYCDNSFGNNIATQLCQNCISHIMTPSLSS